MKKTVLAIVFVLVSSVSFAATVHLNSGLGVSGNVVETTADNIKMDVDGVTLTYYKDEVRSIEGDDAAAGFLGVPVFVAEAPVAPAAAVAPLAEEPQRAVTSPEAVQVSSDKKDKVLKFVEVFGTRETMKMNLDQILSSMPAEDAEKLRTAFNVDEVIERLVPLYDKYFTSDDLDTFIQFYSSPAGRKLVQNIPLLMKDSVDVSAQYFEEKMPEDFKEKAAAPVRR